jgi:DNA-directed RNA polymerase subunit K/omega
MAIDNITGLKQHVPGGKYALTRAIAERATQLQNGALPLTEVRTPNPISVAIEEVLEGKISFEIKEGTAAEAAAAAAAAEAENNEDPEIADATADGL